MEKATINKATAIAQPITPAKAQDITFQFVDNRPEIVAQRKIQEVANESVNIIQPKANNTGLPNNLKSGIENLSGFSMDDVKVHYNSPKPAQLQAHAYAQGTDIHIASGQEKHLPHEAWHVVQQKQGRVKPTIQMKGKVNINDDAGLEKEADVMGGKAAQLKLNSRKLSHHNSHQSFNNKWNNDLVQLNRKEQKRQKAKQKQETFKRRQNLKKELKNSKTSIDTYDVYKEQFEGDELALANLNNAWKDFQSSFTTKLVNELIHSLEPVALYNHYKKILTTNSLPIEALENAWIEFETFKTNQNKKSDKRHRADLMQDIFDSYNLKNEGDNIEDTDSSDGEDEEKTVYGRETSAYKKPTLNKSYIRGVGKLGDFKTQGAILSRLVKKEPKYQQLAINLALHNHKTSLGGKRSQFRFTGHKTHYQRPFQDPVPGKILRMLRDIKTEEGEGEKYEGQNKKGVPEAKYSLTESLLTPTRFAVTLPLHEPDLKERIQNSEHKELGKFLDSFSEIGSFGFSERSKTTWKAEVGEKGGTRLSLGDGISEEMFVHLKQLISLVQDEINDYVAFGSPNQDVLKVHAVSKEQLTERRKGHLSDIKKLILDLKKLLGKGHQDILYILNRHRKVFGEEESESQNFIVRESDLWEELIHVSTLLSESTITALIGEKHYHQLNDDKTTEKINVGDQKIKRHLFPSGSKAAEELYEHLEGEETNVKQTKGNLTTYTPYFEFYIEDHSLLTKGAVPEDKEMQAWINISESAHEFFLTKSMKDGVLALSQSIIHHVDKFNRNDKPLKLVIDYTKFSSDLPKVEIYPLLTDLRNTLVADKLISSVYYLKSTLKYNTGALERYQAGEVLSYEDDSSKLEERATESFKEQDGTTGSALNDHYIDLMRKVDVLSDQILTLRRKRLIEEHKK